MLLDQLNEGDGPSTAAKLDEATAAAAEYGQRAAACGASLSQTVEAFVRFREAFVGELAGIARRRRLDTHEATALLVEAETTVDKLLMALMNGHSGQS